MRECAFPRSRTSDPARVATRVASPRTARSTSGSGSTPRVVRERPSSGAKDWYDALRATRERAEGQGQEDNWAPGQGWGHAGHRRDEHDRGQE